MSHPQSMKSFRGRATAMRALTYGAATAVSNVLQFGWLALLALTTLDLQVGQIIVAQAIYTTAQIAMDNGTAFHGARIAASGALTTAVRETLSRTRVVLAVCVSALGLVAAALSSVAVVVAYLPYVIAMLLFSALNVWEPFGKGNVRPWSMYVLARSVLLLTVAVASILLFGQVELWVPGCAEALAILGVMASTRATTLPSRHGSGQSTRSTLAIVFRVGMPALITQATLAAGPYVLGAANQFAAAAVVGISLRIVWGVQQVNGIVATAAFPTLARSDQSDPDIPNRGQALSLLKLLVLLGFALGMLALGVGALASPVLKSAFLPEYAGGEASIVIALVGAVCMGPALQLTLALISRHHEAGLVPIGMVGFAITVAAALVAVGQKSPASFALVGYVLANVVSANLLFALSSRCKIIARRGAITLAGVMSVVSTYSLGAVLLSGSSAYLVLVVGLASAIVLTLLVSLSEYKNVTSERLQYAD